MKTLYIDCGMGAAGDMLMSALMELVPHADDFILKLNSAGIPNVNVIREPVEKCGISCTHISVLVNGQEERSIDHNDHELEHQHHHHDHEHHHDHDHEHEHHHHHHEHNGVLDIERLIDSLSVSDAVKTNAKNVYKLIEKAEASVHGKEVHSVHFHEVGAMDAVADIVGVCMLMEELAPQRVVVSPIRTGFGHVHCAHGILPIPAPATLKLLFGIPCYAGDIKGELCTPTGAALISYFATEYGTMPLMNIEKNGYGAGTKDFPIANIISAAIGYEQETDSCFCCDTIALLTCSIDDMTGEDLGFACERIMAKNALDAYFTPIYMKKNRPGYMLTVLAKKDDELAIAKAIFKHTTTLGIRKETSQRYVLEREIINKETKLGDIRMKTAKRPHASVSKIEFEDAARIARENDLSLTQAKELIYDLLDNAK